MKKTLSDTNILLRSQITDDPHGEIKVKVDGVEKSVTAEGNGPISAFVRGMQELGTRKFTVERYHEQALGKGADALTDFWPRLKRSGARIEAVAMDMSPAYISAVRTNLPESMIVFDRFHVVKLMNEKLSVLRRDIHRELQDKAQKDVLKGSRWLLLKNPENLNMERGEWDHLQEILTANQPLALGYYMKEELRLFWEQPDREAAVEMLEGWLARARASKVKILVGLADTLERHWDGLLAWYDCPIGTGKLEGVNNKIRALTRQAYGFRDQEFFRLQLFGLHETRTELVGVAA